MENHYSLGEMAKALGGQVGSWTPEIWDSSFSGSEGQTYGGNNTGKYFRIGNMVFIFGFLDVSSLGTLTAGDDAFIGNLPYAPSNYGAIAVGYSAGFNLAAATAIKLYTTSSVDKKLILWTNDTTGGGSRITIGELGASVDMTFSGFYFTDDAV